MNIKNVLNHYRNFSSAITRGTITSASILSNGTARYSVLTDGAEVVNIIGPIGLHQGDIITLGSANFGSAAGTNNSLVAIFGAPYISGSQSLVVHKQSNTPTSPLNF